MAKHYILFSLLTCVCSFSKAQWSGNDNQTSSTPSNNQIKSSEAQRNEFKKSSIGITLYNSFTRQYQNAIDRDFQNEAANALLTYENTGLAAFEVEALNATPLVKSENPVYLTYGYSIGFGWCNGDILSGTTKLATFDNFMSAYDIHVGFQKALVLSDAFQFKFGAGTTLGYFTNKFTTDVQATTEGEIMLKPNINLGMDISKLYLRYQYNVPFYILDDANYEIDGFGSLAIGYNF